MIKNNVRSSILLLVMALLSIGCYFIYYVIYVKFGNFWGAVITGGHIERALVSNSILGYVRDMPVVVVYLLLGIYGFVTGIGVLKDKSWARKAVFLLPFLWVVSVFIFGYSVKWRLVELTIDLPCVLVLFLLSARAVFINRKAE